MAIKQKDNSMEGARIKRNLHIQELAKLVGVSPQAMGQMIKGSLDPSVKTAHKIAEALRMGFDELFTVEVEKKNG